MEEKPCGEVKEEIKDFGKEQRFKASAEDIREEVKPIANRFIKQISLYANNRYVDGGRMTAAIALAVAERVVVNLSAKVGPPGSNEKKKFIVNVYDSAKRDALQQAGFDLDHAPED